MKLFTRFIFIKFIILCTSYAAFGQAWDQQFKQITDLRSSGKQAEAFEKIPSLLENAESTYTKEHGNYIYSLQLAQLVAVEAGDWEAAESYGDEYLSLYDQIFEERTQATASVINIQAQIKSEYEKYDRAADLFQEYMSLLKQLDPKPSIQYADAAFNMGMIYLNLNNSEEAKKNFATALNNYNNFPSQLGENYILTLFYLGELALEIEDYEEVKLLFANLKQILDDSGLESSPIYPNVTYGLALSYQELGDNDQALANYNTLISIKEAAGEEDELYASALNNAATIYQFKGDINASQALLNKAGQSSGGDVTSMLNQAALAFARGDFPTAIQVLQPAVDSLPQTQEDSIAYLQVIGQLAQYNFAFGDIDLADSLYYLSKDFILELKGDQSGEYAEYLQNRGWFYYSIGQIEKGKDLIDESLTLKKKIYGDKAIQLANSLNSLGVILQNNGRYRLATNYFMESLEIIAETRGKQNTEYASALNNLAAVRQEAGSFSEAENYFIQSLSIIRQLLGSDHEEYAGILDNLGSLYLGLGNPDRADSTFRIAQETYKKKFGIDSESYANTLLSRSKVNVAKADYTAAEDQLREALNIIRKISGEGSVSYASASNDLAFLYQNVGNFDAAEPLLVSSLQIFENRLGNRHPQYITTLENLATLKQLKGETEKAEELLLIALEADREVYGTRHPKYAVTLHNLAALYQAMDSLQDAKKYYLESIEIDQEVYGEKHPVFASTMYNLAILYQDLDSLNTADSLLAKVIDIRKEVLGEKHPDYIYSLYGKAVLLQRMGENDAAMPLFEKVIEEYLYTINEYFPALSENEKAAYFKTLNPVFNAYKDFALEMSFENPELLGNLMDLQLATKAILLNATNKVRNRILNSGNEELINTFKEWQALKDNLVKYYSYTVEQLENESIVIQDLEEKANELEKLLSRSSEAFSKEFDKIELNWQLVQKQLHEEDALVEIIRLRKNLKNDSIVYVAIIIKGDTTTAPQSVVMASGKDMESRYLNAYKNSIKFKLLDKISYDHFWADINRELNGVKNIYVSPDGVYNQINLNTLYIPEAERYLVEEKSFRFVSSSRDLLEGVKIEEETIDEELIADQQDNNDMMDPEIPKMQASLFGFPSYNFDLTETEIGNLAVAYAEFRSGVAPLPGTKTEVTKLDSILSNQSWATKVFMGTSATEEAIHEMQSPDLLHIATHGFFEPDISGDDAPQAGERSTFGIELKNARNNPLLRSGLLLAGAELTMRNLALPDSLENDGVLTAYEAMNLNLDNTKLVVLSACETNVGEVKNGEGVYGLQRAFQVAGAKHLVMSLWKVNDATTQMLMTLFYQNWASGMEMQEAFKQAQIELKNEYSHPYFWGAFVMIGK